MEEVDEIKKEMKKLNLEDIGVINSISITFNNPPKFEEIPLYAKKLCAVIDVVATKADILITHTDPFGKVQHELFKFKEAEK